jgi:putative phage-type endonuclease
MREIHLSSREEWLEARRNGIGASDAPAILGLSKYRTPFTLFHEKLGLAQNDAAETEAAEWGLTLEEPMSKRFERDSGRPTISIPPFLMYQHETVDWMLATLDRWQIRDGIQVPLELKTANWVLDKDWKEEPPLAYLVQHQHQLAVTGAPRGSIAGLIGGQKFVWADIERDEAFLKILFDAEQEFWNRVLTNNPPPVDATEQTTDTLKRLYATETGEVIALGPEAIDWDAKFEAAKEVKKKAEEEERLYKNLLLNAIGKATVGQLPNDVLYTLKTQTTKEHIVKTATFRVLRRKGPKGEA